MPNLKIRILDKSIVLERYPFFRRNRGRTVPAEEISEAIMRWAPPAIRTSDGEFLFVPAQQRDELAEFALRCGIPLVERTDVWSYILEPFLDTAFDEKTRAQTTEILTANGVPEDEVIRMRRLVGSRMWLWTAISWEWCYYGLFDVLCQMKPLGWLRRRRFARFYGQAMDLAGRGRVAPAIPDGK